MLVFSYAIQFYAFLCSLYKLIGRIPVEKIIMHANWFFLDAKAKVVEKKEK